MLTTEIAARMCPKCGEDSKVYDTRERADGAIIRKRKCVKCQVEFETIEVLTRIYPNRKKVLDIENKN